MLSKILRDADDDVRPVVWQRRPTVPASEPRASSADDETLMQQQMKQAFESGRREGELSARQRLEAEVRQHTQQLAQSAADVAQCRAAAIRRAESDVVQLSFEIARRILHRELSVDRSALSGLIRAALEKLVAQEVHRVRVHPDQEPILRTCLEETGRGAGVEIVSDPTQPRGGAVFESSRGTLDASVETQLSEIERGLIDQLQERA
jgi:flagellar assembly protein FliH